MSFRSVLGVVLGCACALAQTPAFAQAGGPFDDKSDAELTQLAAQWESLDQDERRALLTEFRSRMAQSGKRPVITIKAQRRFGRIVRDAEGNQVRIETTHVVRMKREAPGREQPFGVGFEQRQVVSGEAEPPARVPEERGEAPLPVIHVGTPTTPQP